MRKNIVLVGAGGTGLSGLAMMLYDLGYKDIVAINDVENGLTDRLRQHGIRVIIGHGKYSVDFHDLVIYSDIPAIVAGPEVQQSLEHQRHTTKKFFHICLTYNQFVAELSKLFTTISVAGSNGKTSTSALLIWTLYHLSKSSSSSSSSNISHQSFGLGLVGGLMPNFDQQGYALSPDSTTRSHIKHLIDHIIDQKHQLDYSLLKQYLFVIEACEYKEHFLLYDTDYALITNIARDHTDYYHTLASYHQAFVDFISRTRKFVVVTDQVLQALYEDDLSSSQILVSKEVEFESQRLIGSYSSSNAGMVKCFVDTLKLQKSSHQSPSLSEVLSSFRGVGRRMEYLGQLDHKAIYSDYGHHAPALEGNIKALKKKFPDKHLCVVFQPHQAQRVLAGREDFKQALAGADTTIIYRLYTAREDFVDFQRTHHRLSGLANFDELGKAFAKECKASYITTFEELRTHLQALPEDSIVVYFSAGDLDQEMKKALVFDASLSSLDEKNY